MVKSRMVYGCAANAARLPMNLTKRYVHVARGDDDHNNRTQSKA